MRLSKKHILDYLNEITVLATIKNNSNYLMSQQYSKKSFEYPAKWTNIAS